MPVLHLLIEKALIILPAAGDNREMVRVKRLDDNLPGRLGTAAAPGRLHDQIERHLHAAKVRPGRTGVGVKDTDQRDLRKVQTLGDHLRADQDIRFMPAELFKQLLMRFLARCRIGVHAQHTGLRKQPRDFFLQLLQCRSPAPQTSAIRISDRP